MKKILAVLFGMIILIGLSACGSSDDIKVEGKELVTSAQVAYIKLDSARLVITDCDTEEVKQQFTFKYDEDDILTYLYESAVEGKIYYEYNNGKSVQIQQSDEVKTYKWPSSKFKKYKRSDTHSNADTGIFFFEPDCIKALDGDLKDAKITITDSGTSYLYDYDMELLAKKMTTETSDGQLTAFTTEYFFDNDDEFQKLLETSTFDNDGKVTEHTYSIEIIDRNEIDEITNPME